jgi:hypothetical protein
VRFVGFDGGSRVAKVVAPASLAGTTGACECVLSVVSAVAGALGHACSAITQVYVLLLDDDVWRGVGMVWA